MTIFFFFSSRRRHTRYWRDWSSDVCSSDLAFGREPRMDRRAHHVDAEHDERIEVVIERIAERRREEHRARRTRLVVVVHDDEIGRASCRERVEILVRAVEVKKTDRPNRRD